MALNKNFLNVNDRVYVEPGNNTLEDALTTYQGDTHYVLKKGTYNENINIENGSPYSNIVMEGAGWDDTIVHIDTGAVDNTGDHVIGLEGTGTGDMLEGLYMTNFTVDGGLDQVGPESGETSEADTVKVRYARDVRVENMHFTQTRHRGFSAHSNPDRANENIWLVNNYFGTGVDRNPTYVSADSVIIHGNIVDEGTDTIFDLNFGSEYIVSSNLYKGIGPDSATYINFARTSKNCIAVGNVGYDVNGAGVNCHEQPGSDQNHFVIANNILRSESTNVGSDGIQVEAANFVNVVGNNIEGFANFAVTINEADDVSIKENVLRDGTKIRVNDGGGGSDVDIVNNTIHANDSAGTVGNDVIVNAVADAYIAHNVIRGAGDDAIYTSADGAYIFGNKIENSNNRAVVIDGATGVVVKNNDVRGDTIDEINAASSNLIKENIVSTLPGDINDLGSSTVTDNNAV